MTIARPTQSQEGSTFLEVLVALVLISFVVIALVNGLLTSTKSDNASSQTQKLNAALTSFSEALKDLDYKPCADAAWYQGVYRDALAGLSPAEARKRFGIAASSSVSVTDIKYWRPYVAAGSSSTTTIVPPTNGSFETSCSTATGSISDAGTQLLSFTVTNGSRTSYGQIVKRDPSGIGYTSYVATTTTVDPNKNTAPIAGFTATQVSGGTWTFASTSVDPGGSVVGLSWDLGDLTTVGTSSTLTPSVTHTFYPGLFIVRLIATDNKGATSSSSRTISVAGTPSGVTGFRLVRVRHGGGTAAIYDFAWNRIPGVQEYDIKIRWCLGSWDFACAGSTDYLFGDVAGGSISRSFVLIPGYRASIRARVGSSWGPYSSEISSWS